MTIKILLSDLCSGCKELEDKLFNYQGDDIEINKLDEDAIRYLVEQTGELTLPMAIDDDGNRCSISKNGNKVVIACKDKKIEI